MDSGLRSGSETKAETRGRQQRKELLDEAGRMADLEFAVMSQEIRDGFEREEETIRKELSGIMKQIFQNYQLMEQKGEAGRLRWIYFSFLRTSMMDDYPVYRIDFYDDSDCYSCQECCGNWDFSYVFSRFRSLKGKIRDIFLSQSKVKEYEMDDLLYGYYEKFHLLAAELLCELLQGTAFGYLKEGSSASIEIKEGELFDRTDTIMTIL